MDGGLLSWPIDRWERRVCEKSGGASSGYKQREQGRRARPSTDGNG